MKLDFSNYQKSNLKNGLRNRFGKTNTELYGEEISKRISEKLSFLASQRIGEKNGFYGKKHSDETKNKISKKRMGIKPSNRVKLSIDGKIYDSYGDASKR